MNELSASYALCQRLARQSASNFYFSFWLLSREKRRAMCALYAYLRHVDNLADDDHQGIATRRAALAQLRNVLEQPTIDAKVNLILPALAHTATRYGIPVEYLTAAIDGVEMDLAGRRYETFAELEQYCYCVASVVGLACIHIWGMRGSEALEPARRCGVAFQLTNILRDLREDVQQGRVYLPQEDLRRFDYCSEQLLHGEINAKFLNLMKFEIDRAEQFYLATAELEPLLEHDGQRVFRAMAATYQKVLAKIKQAPADVFNRRVRLNGWEKTRIAAGALLTRTGTRMTASKCEAASS